MFATFFRLQKLVDDIYERFAASGLMHREYEHVKLHATLINSIKRQDDDLPELVVKKRPRISFDARPIMQVSVNYYNYICWDSEKYLILLNRNSKILTFAKWNSLKSTFPKDTRLIPMVIIRA